MAAVCPAGPDPMMMTLRTPLPAGALMVQPSYSRAPASSPSGASLLDGRCLERSSAVLDVDGELDALAGVALDERVAVLLERLREFLERQALGRLAPPLLGAHQPVHPPQPPARPRPPP